jgi:predicted translin family RNA/ssDNA-binding protein
LDYWKNRAVNASNQSNILKELSSGFAQHPTFVSTYTNMTNREFVEAIYKNVLGKNGDEEGIKSWTNYLDTNSRSDMVSNFRVR